MEFTGIFKPLYKKMHGNGKALTLVTLEPDKKFRTSPHDIEYERQMYRTISAFELRALNFLKPGTLLLNV